MKSDDDARMSSSKHRKGRRKKNTMLQLSLNFKPCSNNQEPLRGSSKIKASKSRTDGAQLVSAGLLRKTLPSLSSEAEDSPPVFFLMEDAGE